MMKIFTTFLLLSTLASAGLAWDAAPVGENVTEWRVYRVEFMIPVRVATVTEPRADIPLSVGDTYYVTAFNGIESLASEMLTIPAPVPMDRLTIQTSDDLGKWRDIQTIEHVHGTRRFYRIKIETP